MGSVRRISSSERSFPVPVVRPDPGKGGNFHWGQRRDQRAGVCPKGAVGQPCHGWFNTAHSHGWQSKAAWPGAESIYFIFCCQSVSSNRFGEFGFFSDFSVDKFSVCLSHMDHDLFSLWLNSSDTKYIGQDLQVLLSQNEPTEPRMRPITLLKCQMISYQEIKPKRSWFTIPLALSQCISIEISYN